MLQQPGAAAAAGRACFSRSDLSIRYGYLQSRTASGIPLDLAHNVIALAEKGVPFVQDRLLLVGQILPLRATILGLE